MDLKKICELEALLSILLLPYLSAWKVFEFEKIQWQMSLSSVTPLDAYTVFSVTQCANLCCTNSYCKSFAIDCTLLTTDTSGQCYLYTQALHSVTQLDLSDQCFVQRKGFSSTYAASADSYAAATTVSTTTDATTTIATTTPIVTTASTFTTASIFTTPSISSTTPVTTKITGSGTTVLEVIYGPMDMCSNAPSSQKDFLVIAQGGVYIYDEVADLTAGPCKGPLEFSSVFNGYSGLTSVDQVTAVMVYQNFVELYATDGNVYQWDMVSTVLSKRTTDSITNHLRVSNSAAVIVQDPVWGAYRNYQGDERHFYMGNQQFFLLSMQYNKEELYNQTDRINNNNNFNMNPWSDIPNDVIAACGYTNEPAKHFILIDNNQAVYTYQLNHAPDNNDPQKILTPIGSLSL